MIIRPATPRDSTSIHDLLKEIAKLHTNGRPDLFADFESKYSIPELNKMLAPEENGVFVADADGRVVGYVITQIRAYDGIISHTKIKTLYVDDLCVDSSFRKMGIATALMDAAVAYGRQKGCYDLELNVWEFNSDALAFYKKYGMKTRTRHMEIIL